MAKRFLNTDLHNNPWYMELDPKYKALWHHILEECNHAGIWQVNFKSAAFFVKAKLDYARCKEVMKNHIVEINNGKFWFIPGFINFQYGNDLNPNNNVHKSVIDLLKEYKITEKMMWLASPLLGAKDKEKDKAKVKDNVLKSSLKNLKSSKSEKPSAVKKKTNARTTALQHSRTPARNKRQPVSTKSTPAPQEQTLPSPLPNSGTPALPNSLLLWVKQNAPRVLKLKKPLTEAECERLLNDFNERSVKNTLLDMENYQKLLTAYTSANLTVRKWLRLDEERNEGKPKRYKPEVDDNNDFTYWEPGQKLHTSPEEEIDLSNVI